MRTPMHARTQHTILVVDDHAATRYSMCRVLQAGGYRTVEAASGEEAMARVHQSTAVVLDVHLPDIDGLEVCRQIRATEGMRSLPVVHVSSVYVTGFAEAKARHAGADDYLISPVDQDTLLGVLDRLLRTKA
jgi:CheY-like chemotaxis protein